MPSRPKSRSGHSRTGRLLALATLVSVSSLSPHHVVEAVHAGGVAAGDLGLLVGRRLGRDVRQDLAWQPSAQGPASLTWTRLLPAFAR